MDLGDGAEAKIKLFSKYGHVAYQIKADDDCNNMVANILHTDIPGTQGKEPKVKLFLLDVILHIKLKGSEHRAP